LSRYEKTIQLFEYNVDNKTSFSTAIELKHLTIATYNHKDMTKSLPTTNETSEESRTIVYTGVFWQKNIDCRTEDFVSFRGHKHLI